MAYIEMEEVNAYTYEHSRLGLVRVSECENYKSHYPKGGVWLYALGTASIILDTNYAEKEERMVELLAELERLYWWPGEMD